MLPSGSHIFLTGLANGKFIVDFSSNIHIICPI